MTDEMRRQGETGIKQAGRSVRRWIRHEPVIGTTTSGIEYEMTREREPPPAYLSEIEKESVANQTEHDAYQGEQSQ